MTHGGGAADAERRRLAQADDKVAPWRRWGPYRASGSGGPYGRTGHRPVHGAQPKFARDPHRKDLLLFYAYFHGDNGAGLGASHQTGWTGLVAATATLFHSLSSDDWHRGGRESLKPVRQREEPLP
ncbi:hypothetical protein [Streptomyces sp. NPDC058335]|uniref:hypothetical protein n=1 Tax=Streptomyces sp. NPDC058335 TaxID=3346451 RepID=UPI00365CCBA4